MRINIVAIFETTSPISDLEAERLRSAVHQAIRTEHNNIGLSDFDDENNVIEEWHTVVVKEQKA